MLVGMCGRVVVTDIEQIWAEFSITRPLKWKWTPIYNAGPTTILAVVRKDAGGRFIDPMRWGLIPSWSRDTKSAARMINARIETIAEKPAYRSAFQRRRCVVAVSGFFEWKHDTKPKQPFYITRVDGRPLALAGLWEAWTSPDGEVVETCCVITKPPVAPVAELHDRMPAILPLEAVDRWLDSQQADAEGLRRILLAPSPGLRALPVSMRVNSVANQGPECIEAVSSQAELSPPFRLTPV